MDIDVQELKRIPSSTLTWISQTQWQDIISRLEKIDQLEQALSNLMDECIAYGHTMHSNYYFDGKVLAEAHRILGK